MNTGTAGLFSPLTINSVTVPNRFAMGPIAAHSPTPDGRPSDQTIAFFAARAKGGVGLIIVGGTMATAHGWDGSPSTRHYIRHDKEEFLPDLRRLADAVHEHETPIFVQVNVSMGRMGKPGPHHIAASPVGLVIPEESLSRGIVAPGGLVMPPPREATLSEIKRLEHETADSAIRLWRAGFDGVELGAHMSYFLASFLSARTNQRTDNYGGGAENRARVVVNILRQIRAKVGADFPIGARITANEHVDGGQGPQGYVEIARILEREGIDYFALTDGAYETMNLSSSMHDGGLIDHGEAQAFKQAVSVPLMLQSIHDPHNAADAIAAGHGDMVMLARQMLADPDYPNKVRDDRVDAVNWCNGENHCARRLMLGMPIRCPVNPRMGRESRPSNGRPPVRRIAAGTLERAILRLTSYEWVMRPLIKVAARRAARQAT